MFTRILLVIGVAVFVALLYVGQQVEVVKLGYEITWQEQLFADLLDQNRTLLYNTALLESPAVLKGRSDALRLGLAWGGVPQSTIVERPRLDVRRPGVGVVTAATRTLRDWLTIERSAEAETPARRRIYPSSY